MVNNTFLTLVKRAKGRIVNTTSFLSRLSPPFNTQYTMAKFALRSYTDGLRSVPHNSVRNALTFRPGSGDSVAIVVCIELGAVRGGGAQRCRDIATALHCL